jgi:BirA family biotin operon repressor/biotin-[acetyl-CoA-carboxylase] ligase
MLDSGGADARPGRTWFALAFGVNIIGAPGELDQPTQYLSAFLRGPVPSPEVLLADIRGRLETWERRLESEGFTALRAAWLARAHGLGRTVCFEVGGRRAEGVFAGLSEKGELELETAEGLVRISAGDIHFPELAAV